MYVTKILNFALLFFLIAWVSCQEGESNNVTSAEESTTDVIKTIQKRQTLANINDMEEQEAQQTTFGLNSLLIQIVGGLVKNFFNNNGINTQTVDSAINLFSVDKVKQNLVLFRRGLNLLARFAVFLNKYLPSTQGSNDTLIPLNLFSSKVRFYSTDPGSYQWFNTNNAQSTVPPHIQRVVDFATQKEEGSTAAVSSEPTEEPARTVEVFITERSTSTSTEDNVVAATTTIPTVFETRGTTNSTQENGISAPTQNTITTAASLSFSNANSASNSSSGSFQLNFLGLPINGNGLPYSANDQVFNKNPTPTQNTITTTLPQSFTGFYNPSELSPYNFYGLPINGYGLPYGINNQIFNRYPRPVQNIVTTTTAPTPSNANSDFNSVSSQFNFFGLPINGFGLPYSTNDQMFNKNPKSNQNTNLELPGSQTNVQFKKPSFSPDFSSPEEKRKHGTIADLPLEYPTFADRANGQLRDSFGLPVKTDFGSSSTPTSSNQLFPLK